MRVVDRDGLEVTTAPTNPSLTIKEIDGAPSVSAHTLRTTGNVLTNLGLGRVSVQTIAPAGNTIGSKLILSGGLS